MPVEKAQLRHKKTKRTAFSTLKMTNIIGVVASLSWLALVGFYVQGNMGFGTLLSQQPHILGGFLAGILAPLAFLWMFLAYLQRHSEVKNVVQALREELQNFDPPKQAKFTAFDFDPDNNMGQINAQAVELSSKSESALNSIHRAKAGLGAEMKSFMEQSKSTEVNIDRLAHSLEARTQRLIDLSDKIEKRNMINSDTEAMVDKVAGIADKLNGSLETIQNSVNDIESRAGSLEERLKKRVSNLNEIVADVDQKITRIEKTGDDTANKISGALDMASKDVGVIGTTISGAVDKIMKVTTESQIKADALMAKADDKANALNAISEAAANKLEQSVNMLDQSGADIKSSSDFVDSQVTRLTQSVEKQAVEITKAQDAMDERVKSVEISMTAPLEAMGRVVEKAESKHLEIEEALSSRISELNNASDKALSNAQNIREGLRAQSQEISTLVGQIAGHSRSARSLMSDEKDNLATEIMNVIGKIGNVGSLLKKQSDQLTNVSDTAEKDISRLKSTLSEHVDIVEMDSAKVIDELNTLDQSIGQKVQNLIESSVAATRSVNDTAEALEKSGEVIAPIHEKASLAIARTKTDLENMAKMFDAGTTSHLEKLKTMGILFDERLDNLSVAAANATELLDASGQNFNGHVANIETVVKSASEKMQQVEDRFKKQSSTIHLTTDQALLKIESVQKALNNQFDDLSVSVGESMAQMDDASTNFVQQVAEIRDLSGNVVEQFDVVGIKADEQKRGLRKLADETRQQMEEVSQRVREEASQMLETSGGLLMDMKKTGDDFSARSKKMEEHIKASLDKTKEYGSSLNKQADQVVMVSDRTAGKIAKAISSLSMKMKDIDKVANDAQAKIESSRGKLESETDYLADVSIKAAKVVDEAAAAYLRQSTSLFKAAQDAEGKAEKIRDHDVRLQRESFLHSAKFVLESLHSLAVDITRMAEGSIQEKIWKAYQKGDIGAFTRHLVENKTELPVERMVGKYKNDYEFRTYINRFIRQFEDVYEQATENDHGAVLAATFATSDIGALYGLMCEIAEHSNKIDRKFLSAA